jgi:hypothetical protein
MKKMELFKRKNQRKNFDFFEETISVKDHSFPKNSSQKEIAKSKNVTRILKFRYTWDLPTYILDSAYQKGYKAVMLGYTTNKSSTWGFYKR